MGKKKGYISSTDLQTRSWWIERFQLSSYVNLK